MLLRPPPLPVAVSSTLPLFSHLAAVRRRSSIAATGMAGVSAASPAAAQIGSFLSKKPYAPPSWASHLALAPPHTFSLGHFPTPIHKWNLPNLPEGTEVWIKRDDLSGMQLSGNKVRKLEFLLSDAVAQGADCVITVGGIQSNHCRATAVAAKYLNLDCYLILRTSKLLVDEDPGLVGNLLVERLLGAHIDLVSKEEYGKIGSVALADLLKKRLLEEGRKPYVIPVGGSNSLGTWGYIEAVRELEQQIQLSGDVQFDDIVVACGSGGTVAGLALGSKLSSLTAKVHAFSVCDDPEYFYDYVQGLIDGLQSGLDSHDIVSIQNAKGLGYAMNTAEELKFVKDIATATGILLDPVYSGKGAYAMLKDMADNPSKWKGRKVLFVHTGGLLGLYDKVDQMSSLAGSWRRMDLEESVPRKDGTACRISSTSLSGLTPYRACTFISMNSSRGIRASVTEQRNSGCVPLKEWHGMARVRPIPSQRFRVQFHLGPARSGSPRANIRSRCGTKSYLENGRTTRNRCLARSLPQPPSSSTEGLQAAGARRPDSNCEDGHEDEQKKKDG